MKRKNNPVAQSILEYAVVIVIAAAALLAMFAFLKRHIQSSYRDSADSLGGGRQYQE